MQPLTWSLIQLLIIQRETKDLSEQLAFNSNKTGLKYMYKMVKSMRILINEKLIALNYVFLHLPCM